MSKPSLQDLTRRERQIMDIIFGRGQATAAQVVEAMSSGPSDPTVRKLIRVLEEKGFLTHARAGRHFVYRPTHSRKHASRTALRKLMDTFFQGSAVDAVAALLHHKRDRLTPQEAQRLISLIESAESEGQE